MTTTTDHTTDLTALETELTTAYTRHTQLMLTEKKNRTATEQKEYRKLGSRISDLQLHIAKINGTGIFSDHPEYTVPQVKAILAALSH